MGRKRRSDEISFGSDSFLDIVANMVGIIIILILVVGLRIHYSPPTVESVAAAAQQEADKKAQVLHEQLKAERLAENARVESENLQRKREREKELARREQELKERQAKRSTTEKEKEEFEEQLAERKKENERREKLFAGYSKEADELNAQTAKLFAMAKDESAKQESEHAAAVARHQQELNEQLEAKRRLETAAAHEQEVLNRHKATWESLGKQLLELREQISQLQNKPLEVKQWTHYATPISKQVDHKQVHFRCLSGRVADIHLDALLDRARDRLSSVGPGPGVMGVAGPIGGFRMTFTAQRTGQSLTDQLNNPFVYRIAITGWEISAEGPNVGETVEEATAVGSKFRESIETAPPGIYAITMWVYPESFAMARQLRDFLHKRGYDVALRPLPAGIPIAGSPWGSASRSQ